MAERNACPLLDLLQAVPDLFEQEVLKRLDPTARTMLAQVEAAAEAAAAARTSPWLPWAAGVGKSRAGRAAAKL